MLIALKQFLLMDGYATYVWSAYGIVLGMLAIQLFKPWKRWQKLLKQQHLPTDE